MFTSKHSLLHPFYKEVNETTHPRRPTIAPPKDLIFLVSYAKWLNSDFWFSSGLLE